MHLLAAVELVRECVGQGALVGAVGLGWIVGGKVCRKGERRLQRRKMKSRRSYKVDVKLTKVIHNKGPDDSSNRPVGTARTRD